MLFGDMAVVDSLRKLRGVTKAVGIFYGALVLRVAAHVLGGFVRAFGAHEVLLAYFIEDHTVNSAGEEKGAYLLCHEEGLKLKV